MAMLSTPAGGETLLLDVSPKVLAFSAYVAEMEGIDGPIVDYSTWTMVRLDSAFVVLVQGQGGEAAAFRVLKTNWEAEPFRLDVAGEFKIDAQAPEAAEDAARSLAHDLNESFS